VKDSTEDKKIKEEVKKHYGRAILAVGEGPTCCGGDQRNKYADLAGYTPEQLSTLPQGMDSATFGCGNPVDMLDVREGDVVLDLGSGAGLDLILAGRKVGKTGRVIGIDMTPEMIARANENIRKAGLTNIDVRKGEMEDLPVEDNSIDWIISNCVINLSPDKRKVFSEIVRVLKPGGRIMVSDIVTTAPLPEYLTTDMKSWSDCIGGAMLESAYLSTAREAGLDEVKVVGRLDYDRSQLGMFASGCCGTEAITVPEHLIDELAGKLSSVKVSGCKK